MPTLNNQAKKLSPNQTKQQAFNAQIEVGDSWRPEDTGLRKQWSGNKQDDKMIDSSKLESKIDNLWGQLLQAQSESKIEA